MSWGTPVGRGALWDTNNGPTVTVASVAFTSGRLYVAFYTGEGTGGIYDHSTMAVTGQTGSWTFISQTASGIGANARRISAWYYVATATETVSVVFDPPSGNKAYNAATIIEIPSGFDSATPIAHNTPVETGTGAGTFAVNLASAPSASNMSMVGVMNRNNSFAIGPDAGFTGELSDNVGSGTSTDSGDLEVSYKTAATQNCTVSAGSGTPIWGGIHLELAASSGSAITDTDAGTLTDNRSLTGEAVPTDSSTLADNRSLTAQAVNSDTASVAELAVANITQAAIDTDSASLTDSLTGLSIQGIPTDAGTLTESTSEVLAAATADAGTLADARLANVAQLAVDTGTASETVALGAALINADVGALTETQTASQAGTGGGPATDTDTASLVEQAIAELLASVSEAGSLTDGAAPIGALTQGDSVAFTETPALILALATADVGVFTDAESIGGLPPVDSDTDAFTFGDEAVVSYRFPPKNNGTRLMRHGRGTWLHVR